MTMSLKAVLRMVQDLMHVSSLENEVPYKVVHVAGSSLPRGVRPVFGCRAQSTLS